MTPEQIQAAVKAGIAEGLRADAATQTEATLKATTTKLEAETLRADKAEAALKTLRESIGLNADSADVGGALAKVVAEKVQADAALTARANELGVKLPAESTPATRLRDLAIACGADAVQVDAADGAAYARGLIAGYRPPAHRAHTVSAAKTPTAGIRQS